MLRLPLFHVRSPISMQIWEIVDHALLYPLGMSATLVQMLNSLSIRLGQCVVFSYGFLFIKEANDY
jgi:hypothetical protein